MFQKGIKTEEELQNLRQRKQGGKKLEQFHRNQNEAGFFSRRRMLPADGYPRSLLRLY